MKPQSLLYKTCLRFTKHVNMSYMRSFVVPIGETFGRSTVVSSLDGPGKRMVRCRCSCGKDFSVLLASLKSGNTVSCGCSLVDSRTKHGLHNTPEYAAWAAMLQRCFNPKCSEWKNYGARGITVCGQWCKFPEFFEYIGPRPTINHSLDRWPDTNGNYEPENVRWATAKQQSRNTRRTIFVGIGKDKKPLADVAEQAGISLVNARNRRDLGWPEESLMAPVRLRGKYKKRDRQC